MTKNCCFLTQVTLIRKKNSQKRKYTNADSGDGMSTTNDPWIHLVDQLVEVNKCLAVECEKDFSFKCR